MFAQALTDITFFGDFHRVRLYRKRISVLNVYIYGYAIPNLLHSAALARLLIASRNPYVITNVMRLGHHGINRIIHIIRYSYSFAHLIISHYLYYLFLFPTSLLPADIPSHLPTKHATRFEILQTKRLARQSG